MVFVYIFVVVSSYYSEHKVNMAARVNDVGYTEGGLKANSVAPAPSNAADKFARILELKESHAKAPPGSYMQVSGYLKGPFLYVVELGYA